MNTLTQLHQETLPLAPQAGRSAMLGAQATPWVVTCRSSTGWFELEVSATSRHRALDVAWMFIEQHGWDGTPVRAHHRH